MKSPHRLEPFFDEMGGKYIVSRATLAACRKLMVIGKKPHPYDHNKIRVSHRGRYFDYAPETGSWVYTRSAGRRKWNSSSSVEDFIRQVDRFMDWFEKQEDERKGRKITLTELLEREGM